VIPSTGEHRRAEGRTHVSVVDGKVYVLHDLSQTVLSWPSHDREGALGEGHGGAAIRAPINGRLVKLFVTKDARLEKGDRVAVVEAMKMEHVLSAPRAGRVARVAAKEGEQVAQGALVAELEREEGE
jgi:3-methylcrotonyl-CoA carboxylase alpha subunit